MTDGEEVDNGTNPCEADQEPLEPNLPSSCDGLIYQGTFTPRTSANLSTFCSNGYTKIDQNLVIQSTFLSSLRFLVINMFGNISFKLLISGSPPLHNLIYEEPFDCSVNLLKAFPKQ